MGYYGFLVEKRQFMEVPSLARVRWPEGTVVGLTSMLLDSKSRTSVLLVQLFKIERMLHDLCLPLSWLLQLNSRRFCNLF